jgi:hypothetical protein
MLTWFHIFLSHMAYEHIEVCNKIMKLELRYTTYIWIGLKSYHTPVILKSLL